MKKGDESEVRSSKVEALCRAFLESHTLITGSLSARGAHKHDHVILICTQGTLQPI